MSEEIQQTTEQINNLEHNEPVKTELDDTAEQYAPYGIDLIDLKEIQLDTQEGRFNYLTSLVDNDRDIKSERLRVLESGFYEHICKAEPIFRDLDSAGVDSLEEDTRRALDSMSVQKSILENLDFSNSSVIQALKTQSEKYYEMAKVDGMSETATKKFLLMHEAADSLYLIMVNEVKQRKQEKVPLMTEKQEISETSATSERIEYSDVEEVNYTLELQREKIDFDNRIIARDTSDNPGSAYAAKIDSKMAQGVIDTLTSWQNFGDEVPVAIWLEGQRRSKRASLGLCPKDENGEPTGDFADRLSSELNKLHNTGASLVRTREAFELGRTLKLQKNNETTIVNTQGEVIDSTLSQEAMKDVPIFEPEGKPVTSYSIEGGLVDAPITVLVGQEIPNDWFNSKNVGAKNDSGFGITIERPAPIKNYLQSILNIEYTKIDEGERQHYDYSSIMGKIVEEAQRTKKIPDIASIVRSSKKS